MKAALQVANVCGLDHAPTRLFVAMAVVPRDDDPKPAFWGGRDALAAALGVQPSETGYRAVRRALAALASVKVIDAEPAAPNRNARYWLRDGHGSPLRPVPNGGTSPSADPDMADAHVPPEEKEEDKEEEGARPSRSCPMHPTGTSSPCRACGDARRAHDAWTPPKRPPRDCSIDGHREVADGTCMYCADLRPEVAA